MPKHAQRFAECLKNSSFKIDGLINGNPADDEYGELGTANEASCKLSQVIEREGQRFGYEYDFGDSWEHTPLVEKILWLSSPPSRSLPSARGS